MTTKMENELLNRIDQLKGKAGSIVGTIKNKGKNFLNRLNELRKAGAIVIIAGAILIASCTLAIEAQAQAGTLNPDEEIILTNFSLQSGNSNVPTYDATAYETPASQTAYFDVFNDDEVAKRAAEIYSYIKGTTGPIMYTEEEVISTIKLLAGRNPFGRPITVGDVMFMLDRLSQVMDAEGQEVGNKFRGFGNAEVGTVIPYQLFLPDNTHGKRHAEVVQDMRANLLRSQTREEAAPVIEEFMLYAITYYFYNGSVVNFGFDEVERNGFRALNFLMILNTANIVGGIDPNAHVIFYLTGPDGESIECDWTIGFLTNKLISGFCYTTDEPVADGNYPKGDLYEGKVNLFTEMILGTQSEAVMPSQLRK